MSDGTTTQASRSPRFTLWVAFLVFSTITLGASVEEKNNSTNVTSDQKWAVACASITFALSAIVVVMHLLPVASIFIVNTKMEGILCVILMVFWAATVAIVSDASNGLAVDESGTVSNGNLYYFSWAGFVCSVLLFVSYLRGVFGVDVAGELQSRAARLTSWSALLATSLVVMGSSSKILQNSCKGANPESDVFCNRTKYGIALGAFGGFMSIVICGLKIYSGVCPFLMEAITGFVLAVMNGFGVAFLTSSQGPGSPLGNLYYFSWGSFLISMICTASCVEDYQGGGAGGEEQANENGDKDDMPVESMEDTI